MKESITLTFFQKLIDSHSCAANMMMCDSIADVGLAGFRRVTLRARSRIGESLPTGPMPDVDQLAIVVPEGVAARMGVGYSYPIALVVAPDVVVADGAALREKFRDDR